MTWLFEKDVFNVVCFFLFFEYLIAHLCTYVYFLFYLIIVLKGCYKLQDSDDHRGVKWRSSWYHGIVIQKTCEANKSTNSGLLFFSTVFALFLRRTIVPSFLQVTDNQTSRVWRIIQAEFVVQPPPDTNIVKHKEMAIQCFHEPMQKVEFYHSLSIPKSLHHLLRRDLSKCGDCLAKEKNNWRHTKTYDGTRRSHFERKRIRWRLRNVFVDPAVHTTRRKVMGKQECWILVDYTKISDTIEVALTSFKARAFKSNPNSMCVVLAGFMSETNMIKFMRLYLPPQGIRNNGSIGKESVMHALWMHVRKSWRNILTNWRKLNLSWGELGSCWNLLWSIGIIRRLNSKNWWGMQTKVTNVGTSYWRIERKKRCLRNVRRLQRPTLIMKNC